MLFAELLEITSDTFLSKRVPLYIPTARKHRPCDLPISVTVNAYIWFKRNVSSR